jgi:Protein of unknown function (DUF2865)
MQHTPMQRSTNPKANAGRSMKLAVAFSVALVTLSTGPASAQQWWPFGKSETPPPPVAVPAPIPSQPMYRAPGAPPGPGQAGQGQGYGRGPGVAAPGGSAQGGICLQLEQRLAVESNKGSQTRDLLPKLDQELSAADRTARAAQGELERRECFEYFLFSKTLKSNPVCREANSKLEGAKRRVAELDVQRQQLVSSNGRSYQDDIIRELARNNCGSKWTQQANNAGSSIWQDEDNNGGSGGQSSRISGTYRTICVRLCDGYYFPVSFSTLPEHFDRDADACQSKCAAPVELYYHPTPGSGSMSTPTSGSAPTGGVEQALSHKTKQVYSTLKVAFLYRNKFLPGCSCKQAEYLPSGGTERRADAAAGAPTQSAQPKR